jgi:type IV pilus assembly protein PilO
MTVNIRDPKIQKIVVVVAVSIGIIYLYFNYVYANRTAAIKELYGQIAEKQELLDRGKRVAQNFQKVQEDYQNLLEVWGTAEKLLPTQKEMEGLLKNITLAGQTSGVTFMLFRPMDAIEHDYYYEYPIQIKTNSTYHELGQFLSAIATMNRIVNVMDLKCNGIRPRKGEVTHDTVQSDFVVVIYVFKELAARMKPPKV